MFSGFYNYIEKINLAWNNNIYHTRDIACKDEDRYIWYVGKNDDIIKSSKYRIGPFKIEIVLLKHSLVLECVVTEIPNQIRGQVVKVTIVISNEFKPFEQMKQEIQSV